MSQARTTDESAQANASKLLRFRPALTLSVVGVLAGIVGAIYGSGMTAQSAKDEVRQLQVRQADDHDSLTKLTGKMQEMIENHDRRLLNLELVTSEIRANYVTKAVHEEHWRSDEESRHRVDDQLRTLQQDIKEILTNVKK